MALRFVQFANLSTLIGPGGVKVAQSGKTQAVCPVISFERILEKQFRNAIRIHRLPRNILRNRHLGRNSIHSASRRENDPAHAAIDARIQQDEPSLHVVAKVFPRVRNRFTHIGMRGKVHDRIDPAQGRRKGRRIRDIAPNQLESASQKFVPGRKIVINDDLMPAPPQSPRRMTADVTRPSDDQNDQCFLRLRPFSLTAGPAFVL